MMSSMDGNAKYCRPIFAHLSPYRTHVSLHVLFWARMSGRLGADHVIMAVAQSAFGLAQGQRAAAQLLHVLGQGQGQAAVAQPAQALRAHVQLAMDEALAVAYAEALR